MPLDHDVCYRALETRDERFDGRFFIGVRTTGIYCRPICPALRPKRKNCVFLPCAAAAQEAGFRPCLRCRPEAAPGTPAWNGTSTTVTRALRLIEDGALDREGVPNLATRLGVGERHLRRLFTEHIGASPLSVAHTRRLLFAKKLIDETALPMTELAHAAGFRSLRRFNGAIQETYGRSPSTLRRRAPGTRSTRSDDSTRSRGASAIRLRLGYRPPLEWDALLAFFALRAIPGVEEVCDGRYRRTLRTAQGHGSIEVAPAKAPAGKARAADTPSLEARLWLPSAASLAEIHDRLRRLFDLSAEPRVIAERLGTDALLRRSIARRPGLRVPGCWDGFELAVRAILGQQVSVKGASTLAGRLVERYGERLSPESGNALAGALSHVFPEPARLVRARVESIGLPRARARAISALARAVDSGRIELDGSADPERTREALCELPGIGDWTAQYISMRALGDPDAFPAGDLILQRAAGSEAKPLGERALRERSQSWRPWRSYAVLHLWQTWGERQTWGETQS
jgi:AraC family transcriptional regulator of adaptative response / DNA-3-methyladenine glycosylase II